MTAPSPAIHGDYDPRFAAVREAFHSNFLEHSEVGAAVCIEIEGQRLVDLWGAIC